MTRARFDIHLDSTATGVVQVSTTDPGHPGPVKSRGLGKVFGLSKPRMQACAEEILDALDGWPRFAEQAGLGEYESNRIADRFNP